MTKIKNFFKSITNSKKKVFALALSACVVVLSIASSSIAYFTDTEEYTNTFTSGKVDIALNVGSQVIDESSYSVADKAVPGTAIERVTNISVKSGSENAYLGAIITVTGGTTLLTHDSADDSKIYAADLFKNIGGAVSVEQLLDGSSNHIGYTISVVFADEYVAGNSVNVFDGIVIPEVWEQDDIEIFKNVTINVVAYAVQSEGLANAAAALHAAFPDAF